MAGQVVGPYFAPVKGKVSEDSEEAAEEEEDMMELGTSRSMGHNLLQYILNADPASSDELRTTTSFNDSEFSGGRVRASPVLAPTEGDHRPSRLYYPTGQVRSENVERRCHLKNCNNNRVYEKNSTSTQGSCHTSRKTPPALRHTCKSGYPSKGRKSRLIPHHIAKQEAGLESNIVDGWHCHDMDSFEDSGIEQSLDLPDLNNENPETSPRDHKDPRLVDTSRQDRYHNDDSGPTDDTLGRGRKKAPADGSLDRRSCETRTTFCSSGMSSYGDRNAELAQGRAVLHTYRRKSSADMAQDLLKYQGKHKMLKYNGEQSEAKLLKRPHTAPPTTAGQTAEFMLQRAYFSLEHADIKRRNAEIIKMQQEHTRHHQRLKHLFDLEWQQQQMRNMHLYARDHGNSDGSYHDLSNMHYFNRKCCHGKEGHQGDGRKDRAKTAPPGGNQKDDRSKSHRPGVSFPGTKPFLMPKRQAKMMTDDLVQSRKDEDNNTQKRASKGTLRTRRKETPDRTKDKRTHPVVQDTERELLKQENMRKAEMWSLKMKWEPVKL